MRPQRLESSVLPVPLAAPAQSLSDEEVVRRVLAGDASLYETIMRRYNQRLFRTLRATIPDDREAEDAMRESYVKAFFHLGEFEGRGRFSTWLLRIAIQEALDRGRNGAPHHGNGNAHDVPVVRGMLERAIEGLPATLRTVYVLRDVDGLATNETADCLGISHVNVRVRLHRARTQLKAHGDPQGSSDVRQLHPFPEDRCERVISGVMAQIRNRAEA
jgi:RNA polymerase sigma-70 factor (ECF subfamily)